jgi:hypothetical protein
MAFLHRNTQAASDDGGMAHTAATSAVENDSSWLKADNDQQFA